MEQFVQKNSASSNLQGSSSAPTSWKQVFKEFENLTDDQASSLWDSHINFMPLDTSLLFPSDVEKMKKIGLQEVCQAMMTKSLEIAALARLSEIELQGFGESTLSKQLEEKEKEIKKLKSTLNLSEKSKKAAEQKIQDLTADIENLKKEIAEKKTEIEEKIALATHLQEQLKAKEERLVETSSKIDWLKTEVTSLEESVSNLKLGMLEQLEIGFNKAKEQILFLNPNLEINFEGSGPFMRIVNNQFIDPLNAEDEDNEEGRHEEEDCEEEDEGEEGHGENN